MSRGANSPNFSFGATRSSVGNKDSPDKFLEPSVKRKYFHFDVIMEEGDGDLKRSCVGTGVTVESGNDERKARFRFYYGIHD